MGYIVMKFEMVFQNGSFSFRESNDDFPNTSSSRHKGEMLYICPCDYTIIDVETTGRNPNTDKLIEVSALKIRNNIIYDTFTSLINPGITIPPAITSLTGISDSDVADCPCSDTVILDFIEFVGDDIIIGHNVSFDLNFIYDCCLSSCGKEFSNNFIDTLHLSNRVLPNLKSHTLSSLCAHFRIEQKNAHRSLCDCISTYQIYTRLIPLFADYTLSDYYHHHDFSSQSESVNKTAEVSQHDETCSERLDLLNSIRIFSLNEPNPFNGKTFVITGELDLLSRDEAEVYITNAGGLFRKSVSSKTDYLVNGDLSQNAFVKNNKSTKIKDAEKLISEGRNIKIISADDFYDMLKGNYIE